MEWTDDVAAGAWLASRLSDSTNPMRWVVPSGFALYAKVLHPASHWMQDAGQPVTWAEAAEAFGNSLEADSTWPSLVRTEADPHGAQQVVAPDGREFHGPPEGRLDEAPLAALVRALLPFTTTPDAGYAAVWEGWGGLLPQADGSSGAAEFGWDEHGSFSRPVPAALSMRETNGPRLRLPHRDHVLFRCGPAEFADADWVSRMPWYRADVLGGDYSPSLIWPDDQAWVIVTEIDFDYTVVGGTVEAIRAVCAASSVEAFPFRPFEG